MFLKNISTFFFIGKIGNSFLFTLDKRNLCQKWDDKKKLRLEIKLLAKHGDLNGFSDLLQVILVGFVRWDKIQDVKILWFY